MINYRIKHIGINHPNAEEASKTAELFRNCFQLERTGGNGNGDIFVGKIFEFKDKNTVGTFGHVALQVVDVEEAMKDLASRGFTFREETISRNEDGKIINVYMQQELGGLAFHICL